MSDGGLRSVSEAVADELAALPEVFRSSARAAIAGALARDLDSPGVTSPASIAKELRAVLNELSSLASASAPEADDVDDLAARREARRSG